MLAMMDLKLLKAPIVTWNGFGPLTVVSVPDTYLFPDGEKLPAITCRMIGRWE